MDYLQYILPVFYPKVLGIIFTGTFFGVIIGALPGLTATMGVALLVPLTFGMDPVMGLNMLIGIYVGGIYGGCISSILVKTPGTAASAATVLDGYPMAQRGEAGKALAMATIASFIGGIFSTIVLSMLAPQLANIALEFGPSEYFALAVFGLTIIASLSADMLKGCIAGLLGMLLACVGADPVSGANRFTFGSIGFASGFAFTPALIGLFAVSEVFVQLENIFEDRVVKIKVSTALPTRAEMKECATALIRGSIIGTFIGIVPGTGSGTASWISYNESKRLSKTPEKYGKGYIVGVAATESANNAVCGGALVPLLALGIPGDVVTAVLLGGLMIQGLQPGPLLFQTNPGIVVGIFAGSFIANIFMFLIGMAGIKYFARILSVPKKILTVSIMIFCFIGSYAINMNLVDLYTMIFFGVIGYFLQKYNFSQAALCIAMILGPLAESNLRLGMLSFENDIVAFCSRPITFGFLLFSVLSISWPFIAKRMAAKRMAKMQQEDAA
ncbi:tripartite tricarboxylate transporter permease [Desulfovibrio sp. OttesenSCG-928-O18]|nr:tripartite tricarboxylate transporter permease [Desulfovibrio sp. OttesenSCG-928-O18]